MNIKGEMGDLAFLLLLLTIGFVIVFTLWIGGYYAEHSTFSFDLPEINLPTTPAIETPEGRVAGTLFSSLWQNFNKFCADWWWLVVLGVIVIFIIIYLRRWLA